MCETDCALLVIGGEENDGLRVSKAFGEKGASQSEVGRLPVELPISVEKGNQFVEVIKCGSANVHCGRREETPNDPKPSNRGVRRGTCMVGEKAAMEAGAVMHGAVRCSALLVISCS